MSRQQRAEFAERIIERFRELKQDEEWTQETLAEAAEISLRTVSDVLLGKSVPNMGTLLPLARAMGISPTPEEERSEWPEDIAVFLDTMGVFLAGRPKDVRRAIMREIAEGIVGPSKDD